MKIITSKNNEKYKFLVKISKKSNIRKKTELIVLLDVMTIKEEKIAIIEKK